MMLISEEKVLFEAISKMLGLGGAFLAAWGGIAVVADIAKEKQKNISLLIILYGFIILSIAAFGAVMFFTSNWAIDLKWSWAFVIFSYVIITAIGTYLEFLCDKEALLRVEKDAGRYAWILIVIGLITVFIQQVIDMVVFIRYR